MRGSWDRRAVLTAVLVLVLALSALLYAGCGGGSSDYANSVLSEWSKLENSTDELVQAADKIEEEADLSDMSDMFSESLDIIASFEDQLDGLNVPSEKEESNRALEDFLAAYDDYLSSTADLLDEVTGGNLDADVPDFDALVDEARNALEEYQDSQDYNQAELDNDVWDLGDTVLGVLFEFYGGEDPDDPKFDKPLEALDDYYIYFNEGDGESMYALLDFASSITMDYSYEFFLAQVGEAFDGGLQAEGDVKGIESYTDEDGNWVVVYMTVDYTETLDMEGNIIPAHSEDVSVELVESQGEWYIYKVNSESGIW